MSESNLPLVSICCITYNHESYIKDAIEGFLIQKTTFPFEIIIHDDASKDGTAKIIKEYELKYPDLFVTIIQKENQYSKGIKILPTYVFSKARGKYIALCEGDDYWIDPYKLQKQVDFMEKNQQVILLGHQTEVRDNLNKTLGVVGDRKKNNNFEVIIRGGGLFATSSLLFRRVLIEKTLPKWFYNFPVGDTALIYWALENGEISSIPDIMSVYRKNVPHSWSVKQTKGVKIKRLLKVIKCNNMLIVESKYKFSYMIKQIETLLRLIRTIIKF